MKLEKKSPVRTALLVLGGFILGVVAMFGFMHYGPYYYTTKYTEPKYSSKPNVEEMLLRAAENYAKSKSEGSRWVAFGDAGMWLVDAGSIERASQFAQELLTLSDKYKDTWNYDNAIHKGNLILGRIALRQGNLEAAKQYLLNAGETPGSPQLDSFGPNMILAKELLEAGEREVVLEYFKLCSIFWAMHFGKLDKWEEIVKSGRIPNFGANLLY